MGVMRGSVALVIAPLLGLVACGGDGEITASKRPATSAVSDSTSTTTGEDSSSETPPSAKSESAELTAVVYYANLKISVVKAEAVPSDEPGSRDVVVSVEAVNSDGYWDSGSPARRNSESTTGW